MRLVGPASDPNNGHSITFSSVPNYSNNGPRPYVSSLPSWADWSNTLYYTGPVNEAEAFVMRAVPSLPMWSYKRRLVFPFLPSFSHLEREREN